MPVFAQSNDTTNRLRRIENEIDTLNRAVYKGETPPAPIPSAQDGEAAATLESRLARIEKDLQELTGRVEQQSYDTQQIQQKLDAFEQDTRRRFDEGARIQPPAGANPAMAPTNNVPPLEANTPPSPAPFQPDALPGTLGASPPLDLATNVTGDETGAAASDAAGLYEQGFGQIKKNDYAAAEKTFAKFMKSYPDHALAPNALYWLGESYYARKEYDKASRAFAEAYQKYPDGPKGADNLLKLGMSLAGKGEKDSACLALGQIKVKYPNGPAPVLAKGESERAVLGCK